MEKSVGAIIAKLKDRYRVTSDQELAESMGLGRSTVAGWRTRQRVPKRYAQLAEDAFAPSYVLPFPAWSPVETQVIRLALFRMIRDYQDTITDYEAYLTKGQFVVEQLLEYTHQALLDVDKEMRSRAEAEVDQCVQILIFREFFAPK